MGGDVTSGLFIKSIIPESPADKCGELKVNGEPLERKRYLLGLKFATADCPFLCFLDWRSNTSRE